jgi:hypothetical protein
MLNVIIPATHEKLEDKVILAGKDTPSVTLRPGYISMEGISVSAKPEKLFSQVSTWIKDYLKQNPSRTELHLKFESLDSHTLRFLFNMIKVLRESELPPNKEILVNWYSTPDDYEVLEYGKLLSTSLGFEFNFETIY